MTIRARKRGAPSARRSPWSIATSTSARRSTTWTSREPRGRSRRLSSRRSRLAVPKVAFLDHVPLTAPPSTDVDTGEALKMTQRGAPTFAALATPIGKPSQSARLRVTGTLTEPDVHRRRRPAGLGAALRTPRNTILLPAGWEVSACPCPRTVSTQADGRVVIQIFDGRPDEGVTVQIRQRSARRFCVRLSAFSVSRQP